VPAAGSGDGAVAGVRDETSLGALLLAIVAEADAQGLDAEAALRRAALEQAEAVRAAEASRADGGSAAGDR